MNGIHVRDERPGDESTIADVNERAFGGGEESRLIEAVRRGGHAAISLVAIDGTTIVGHILFTQVTIESPGPPIAALGLGPMAVVPQRQRQGIGSRLVEAGLHACTGMGCQVVVVVGHPGYYPRFGFRPARTFGLRCEYPVPDDAFMVIELSAGTLAGRCGLVRYLPEFGGV